MADIKIYPVSENSGFVLDKKWIKRIESISENNTQPESVYYGAIPSSGDVEINDVNGEIESLISSGQVSLSKIPIIISVNGKQLQKHISADTDYDTNTKTFIMALSDDIANWEQIKFNGYPYKKGGENAYNILKYVFNSVGVLDSEVDKMLSEKIVFGSENHYNTIKNYLMRIFIPYPYLPSGNLKDTIEKFCVLAQINAYINKDGDIRFVSARPVDSLEKTPNVISIDKKRTVGSYDKDVIVNNKYDFINVGSTVVKDDIAYGEVVGNYINNSIEPTFNIQDDYTEKVGLNYNVTTGITYSVSFVSVLGEYLEDSITIPKNSASNLEEILTLLWGKNENGTDNIKCTITYTPYTSTATGVCSFKNAIGSKTASVSNISKGVLSAGSQTSVEKLDLNCKYTNTFKGISATAEIVEGKDIQNYTNLSTISIGDIVDGIVDNGDSYTIKFKVLVNKETVSLGFGEYNTSGAGTYINQMTGTRKLLKANQIEINFYGNKRVISFDSNFEHISENDSSKKTISIEPNELMQTKTVFDNETPICDLIYNNIKSDYYDGVKTSKIKVPCINMYNLDGDIVKDWSVGDVIEPTNLLHTKKDGSLWRVCGRTFVNVGVPFIETKNQQIVKMIDTSEQKSCVVKFPDYLPLITCDVLGEDGTKYKSSSRIPYGSLVTINSYVKPQYINNARIKHIYLNGVEIKNGDEIIVREDLEITINYDSLTDKNNVVYISQDGAYTIAYNVENYDIQGEVSVQCVLEYDSEGGEILSSSSQSTSRFTNLGNEYAQGYYSNPNNGSFDITINKNYCMVNVPSETYPVSKSMVGKYVGVVFNVWENYNSSDFA